MRIIVAVLAPTSSRAPHARRCARTNPHGGRRSQRDGGGRRHQPRRAARHHLRGVLVSGARLDEARFREVGLSGNYIDSFSVLPVDVDGDGYPDIVDVSWFAKQRSRGGKTPARPAGGCGRKRRSTVLQRRVRGARRHGQRRQARRKCVAQENGTRRRRGTRPGTAPGSSTSISDQSYGHGIGAGDVNKRRPQRHPHAARLARSARRSARAGNWTFHNDWEAMNVPIAACGQRRTDGDAQVPGRRHRRVTRARVHARRGRQRRRTQRRRSPRPATTTACSGSSRATTAVDAAHRSTTPGRRATPRRSWI